MLAIGRRARAAAHALALATPRRRRTARCGGRARRCARRRRRSWPPTPSDIGGGARGGRPAAFIDRLLLDEARIEAIGQGARGDRRAARSGRHRAGANGRGPTGCTIAARARAARRHRHHLREPAERDGRCRRALPQGRQRGDPARRLGEPPLGRAIHACLVARPAARPACPRPPSSSCRPPTAPRSARCWRASTAPST